MSKVNRRAAKSRRTSCRSRGRPTSIEADYALIEKWGGIDVWVRAYETTPEQVHAWIASGEIWQMPATIEHIMLGILRLTSPPDGGFHA